MKLVYNRTAVTKKKLGLAVLLCMAGTGAMAQQTTGWYGGFNIGESRAKIEQDNVIPTLRANGFNPLFITHDDKDVAGKVLGGYQFTPYLGLEASWVNLGNFGMQVPVLPLNANLQGETKIKAFALDLVGTLPITDTFSAFVRAGGVSSKMKESYGYGNVSAPFSGRDDRETDYKYGFGLQYDVSDNLSLRAEAERYHFDDAFMLQDDVDMYSLGVVFRFGSRPTPAPVAAAPAPAPAAAPAPRPTPPPAPPQPGRVTLSADSTFGFDSATLQPAGRSELDALIADLRDVNVQSISVVGHTDRIGNRQYNLDLSRRRAETVRDYLISSSNVPAGNITARGINSDEPVTTMAQCGNELARPQLIACLQPDRRVEVEVTAVTTP